MSSSSKKRPIVGARYPECKDCKHFDPTTLSIKCLRCGAGEYFEERIDDDDPSDEEMMILYGKMSRDEDD
jgi:Zn ribbon nucleic-acid-binding protein